MKRTFECKDGTVEVEMYLDEKGKCVHLLDIGSGVKVDDMRGEVAHTLEKELGWDFYMPHSCIFYTREGNVRVYEGERGGLVSISLASWGVHVPFVNELKKRKFELFGIKKEVTELISNAEVGNTGKVVALLEAGVDMNATDENGYTALHQAVSKNNFEVAELLIKRGCDLNLKDKFSRPPIWGIWGREMKNMLNLFKENKEKLDEESLRILEEKQKMMNAWLGK